MAITTDILATWRHPSIVYRRQVQDGPREDRALVILLVACLLLFVAQWPRLSRQAYESLEAAKASGAPLDQVPSLQALMGITLFTLLFMAPVIFYALAGLSILILRAFRQPVSGYNARMALFWALLATAPFFLFHGLLSGFLGPVTSVTIVGGIVAVLFLGLWMRLLREATKC